MMTNKDKALVAFLVSAGLFSVLQAKQYIGGLSDQQKDSLVSAKEMSGQVLLASGSSYGDIGGDDEHKPGTQA